MNYVQKFGQNHLIDKFVLAKIIDYANINSNEDICEMGSGKGEITFDLCKKAKFVKSFEINSILYRQLLNNSIDYKNLEIINEDILKYSKPFEFDVFVSNIPYSRSRDIFSWLATKKFNRAVILVQKEFAEKILTKYSAKNYRAISAISQYCFDIQQLLSVDKNSFNPKPSVDSKLLKLNSKNTPISRELISIIHYIFSFKNKKVRKISNKEMNLEFENNKVRDLDPKNIIRLAKVLIDLR